MPSLRVVVADAVDPAALAALRKGGCEVVDVSASPKDLEGALAAAWALVVRSRTRVTAALLEKAPRLFAVARAGVGVDNIDVAAATARGVRVVNAPTAATTSVAELTVALLLLLARGLFPAIVATKAGEWKRGLHGGELAGRTVGLVGYGRIAREVARRLEPFGTRILAHDPFVTATGDATRLLPLDALLSEAEFVSLHAALTPENHHLLNESRFARMRRGAYLVNVARGALVDEEALLAALDNGTIAGAALDVFEIEPPTLQKLLQHPRLLATPHLGASTPEAQARAGGLVAEELLRLARGEAPKFLVNPGVGGAR